jgi:hypothetical protein
MDDGRYFNTARQTFLSDIPATIKFKKSVGNYELFEGNNFWELEEGRKMVIIDFCESLRKHKKSTHVTFLKFETLDMSWRRYPHLPETKRTNGFYHFDNNFIVGRPYIMSIEIDHIFPDSIKINKAAEIYKNYG